MSEDPAEQKARDDHDRELWLDEDAYRQLDKREKDSNAQDA